MNPLPCRNCGTSGLVQEVTKTKPAGGGSSYPIEWMYVDCPDCGGVGEFTSPRNIQKWLMTYHCGDVMDQATYEALAKKVLVLAIGMRMRAMKTDAMIYFLREYAEQGYADDAADRLELLQAQNEALRAQVKKQEWLDVDDGGYDVCSSCDSCGNDETTGHAPDCEKAKLLEPIE